jgi:hypothetical protein
LAYQNDEKVLIKDQPSATFEMLLKKAEQEGRIGGKHRCPICGMRFKKEKDALGCCSGIAR